ncbi:MAG TPA: hypothetical protein PKO22_04550 [Treponemataceae bacterium]|nr:hypothetical protein [Treponemataceae bacterium]
MKRHYSLCLIAGWISACLMFLSCGNAPSLTLTASSDTLLSGCVITVRAQAQDSGASDDTRKIDWYIDGVKVPDATQSDLELTREVSEPTTIIVSAKPAGRIGAARASITIKARPVPFKNPLASDYEFTESPVIARGDNQYLDPGAIAFREGKFHASFNAIGKYPEIHFGHAESANGVEWTKTASAREETLTLDLVAKAIGVKPSNIHSGSLLFDKGEWTLYFTAANAGDFFYGNVFRATSANPKGPWEIDGTPVLGAAGNDWFKGDQGLPQIFKFSDSEYRLYYATRKGAVGLARSSNGRKFVKDDKPIANVLHPAIAKAAWGWVMVSNDTVYLSLDGIAWQRYKNRLFSTADLDARKIKNLMITCLCVQNGRFYYFLEGSTSTDSNVYLISWAE